MENLDTVERKDSISHSLSINNGSCLNSYRPLSTQLSERKPTGGEYTE